MGAWSTSITGNDTAQDLRAEYACAFYYYNDVAEAVQKIEEYAAYQGIDESDEAEYCDYLYSLADFMWKKGILTEDIRDRTIHKIDTGFGMKIWEESGQKVLCERKAVLEKFRKQLISPMGARKKIRLNVHTNEIFEEGDLIAIKLMTEGKSYSKDAARTRDLTSEQFVALDGKYVLIQKIGTRVSWRSHIVPEICNCWAVFKLFDGIYDEVPEDLDFNQLTDALFRYSFTPYFSCESSMFYFRKRKYKVLGNVPLRDDVIDVNEDYIRFQYRQKSIYFGIYNEYNDADSDLIAAMGNAITIRNYNGDFDLLRELIRSSYINVKNNADGSKEEAERNRETEREELCRIAETGFAAEGAVYQICFNERVVGFILLNGTLIKGLYVISGYQRVGFGNMLVDHAVKNKGNELRMDVPELVQGKRLVPSFVPITDILEKICQKAGIRIKEHSHCQDR